MVKHYQKDHPTQYALYRDFPDLLEEKKIVPFPIKKK